MAYTRLKYIESNGTQYIDTEYKPISETLRVVTDFEYTASYTNKSLYGSQKQGSFEFSILPHSGFFLVGSSGNSYLTTSYIIGTRHLLDVQADNGILTVSFDGSTRTTNYVSPLYKDNTLYLFASHNGSGVAEFSSCKMYACQIYDNDILVRDYIPAISEKGLCGLWDKVNDVFYTSPNGNNFVGYIEGQELPIGYTRCEYIESDGTQYIDTGFKPNQNTKIDMSASIFDVEGDQYFYGAKDSSSQKSYVCAFSKPSSLTIGYGAQFLTSTFSLSEGEIVDIIQDKNLLYVNGTILATATNVTFQTPSTLYLCARNNNDTLSKLTRLKIYSCKLYDDNVLIRDYIPCQSSESVYGLYDKVNNVFYQSVSEYGFTGKWAEDKKLLVSPSEFRNRLMMLAVNDTKPDYTILDAYGVAIMDIKGKFYSDSASWINAGRPTVNGIAVSDGTHRLCIAKGIINHVVSTNSIDDRECWGAYNISVSGVDTSTSSSIIQLYFNGVANTDAIVAKVTSSDGYFTKAPWSAAGLCRQYIFPNGVNGYLGSCGEWNLVQNSISKINTLMSAISGAQIETSKSSSYWTSSQYSKTYAWVWYFGGNKCSSSGKDTDSGRVRSFCTIDNPQIEVITFYIEGVALTTKEGMTWREYINSGFDKYPFALSEGTYVVVTHTLNEYTNYLMKSDYSRYIELDDVIENGGTYVY